MCTTFDFLGLTLNFEERTTTSVIKTDSLLYSNFTTAPLSYELVSIHSYTELPRIVTYICHYMSCDSEC